MKLLITAGISLLAAIIQTSFLEHIRIFGIEPNLFLVIVVCFALLEGGIQGALIGAVVGIIQDAIVGTSLGGYTLLNMYLGMLVGSVNKRFVRDNIIIAFSFVFVFTAIYEFAFYFFTIFIKGQFDIFYALRSVILPEAVYNSAVSLIIFPCVLFINKWIKNHTRVTHNY